jgi:hypothetical protein
MECCVLLNVTAGNGGGVLENHPYVQELYPPTQIISCIIFILLTASEPFITFISRA